MIRVSILCAVLLTGCASSPQAVRVETVRVNVPVGCVEPANVPALPAPLPPRPDDARPALDIAVAKLVEFMGPNLDNKGGYAGKANALLTGCAVRK